MDWQKYNIHVGYQIQHDEIFNFKLYAYNIYHWSEDKEVDSHSECHMEVEDQDMFQAGCSGACSCWHSWTGNWNSKQMTIIKRKKIKMYALSRLSLYVFVSLLSLSRCLSLFPSLTQTHTHTHTHTHTPHTHTPHTHTHTHTHFICMLENMLIENWCMTPENWKCRHDCW